MSTPNEKDSRASAALDTKSESAGNTPERPEMPKPPTYTPPKSGFLSTLPPAWVPYGELMRIERPAGFYAFYFPHVIGTCYAACIADPLPSPHHVLKTNCIFLLGSFILRGAVCAWNDNIDQDYDRKVARCRLRPIARGAVTTAQGHLFTAALALSGFPLFTLLPLECAYHAIPITVLFAIYPFAKRLTYYPQLVLGFPFAWAIFMCCAAFQVDPFSTRSVTPTASLVAANILWTMIYDTIYAHQDLQDDVNAGVKSMAIRFAHSTKMLTSGLAVAQVALLLVTGWKAGLGPVYFMSSCGGTAVALGSMIARVDLARPESCAWWFSRGFWFVGGCIAVGLLGEYTARLV